MNTITIKATHKDIIECILFAEEYKTKIPKLTITEEYDLSDTNKNTIIECLVQYDNCTFEDNYLIVKRPLNTVEIDDKINEMDRLYSYNVRNLLQAIARTEENKEQILSYLDYKNIKINGVNS